VKELLERFERSFGTAGGLRTGLDWIIHEPTGSSLAERGLGSHFSVSSKTS